MEKEKNRKNIMLLWLAVAVVLTAVICYILFVYVPQHNEKTEINNYKKAIFDSMICQHRCPLTDQLLNNKTQLLPDTACVSNCTAIAKEKMNNSDFTQKDLEGDSLFIEMQNSINLCKKQSSSTNPIDNSTTVNNAAYFACVPVKLELLKNNFSYLK